MRQIGGRCISFMNNLEKNSYVKTQILNALLNMMKKMPFREITVSSLVQTAGVGRASFYRNYKSVEDVLLQEAKRVTEEWKREYDSVEHTQPNELLVSLLDFYKAYEEHARRQLMAKHRNNIIATGIIFSVAFALGRLAVRAFVNLLLGGTLWGGNFL